MEIERKEGSSPCEICEGEKFVHVTLGWKDYSFHCPKCNHNDFVKGIKNVGLSEENAISLILNFGKPGDG